MTKYRAYHFGTFYMSAIQQGIQAAHAQTALIKKYIFDEIGGRQNHAVVSMDDHIRSIIEWADEPTMICLNAGRLIDLKEVNNFLCDAANPHPHACFYEDEESLGGVMTNVVTIIPEKIYAAYGELVRPSEYNTMLDLVSNSGNDYFISSSITEYVDKHDGATFTNFEIAFIDKLRSYSLA